MKHRLVTGGMIGVPIVLALALHFKGPSVPESSARAHTSRGETLPAYPPAMGGPDIVEPAPPSTAEARNRIVNSADLYAAVRDITAQSPTIDKLAAAEALTACADLPLKRRADAADHESVERAAVAQLAERCVGIHQDMGRSGAVEKAVELRMSAERDSSALGRLTSLAQQSRSRARLDAIDLGLVSDALRSRDPVLLLAATDTLLAHFGDGLPDSNLRARAFEYAAKLHAADLRGPPTLFDYLANCTNAGHCVDEHGSEYDTMAPRTIRERYEVERLLKQYRGALQSNASAAELLAIR